MDAISKEIMSAFLFGDSRTILWLLALIPYNSVNPEIELHEKALLRGMAGCYIWEDSMESYIKNYFDELEDQRLYERLKTASIPVNRVKKTKLPGQAVSDVNSENTIVKKHVIAESQDDIDCERRLGETPQEIEVEPLKGIIRFIENTSECSLENPLKIEVEE